MSADAHPPDEYSHGGAGTPGRFEIIIVGAGFAGIGLGVTLKREGYDSFLILERAAEVGGTWRDNTYPGVGCDIPSHLYSFSFRPSADWTRRYASGAEIKDYLLRTVRDEGLTDQVRLGTEMLHAQWVEHKSEWCVRTTRGEYRAAALVLACGRLAEPRIPAVDGVERFRGPWFHSARWQHDIEFGGKRVGIVGSGASAVQLIPEVIRLSAETVLLQRSAPYVVPRENSDYSARDRRRFARQPELLRELREEMFWQQERIFTQRVAGSKTRAKARETALTHLHSQIDDPELRARLTPDYEYGCKRVLLSDDYYAALGAPGVRVIPSALARVRERTLEAVNGERAELDVVIYATGFHTITQPYASRVHGSGGRSLASHWEDGMRAYASTLVAGFPNLFVLNGPNAGLGHNSAIYMIEAQIALFMRWLASGANIIDPSPEAEADYVSEIEKMGRDTVWMTGGCDSWYLDRRAGRLTLLWPDFASSFRTRLEAVDPGLLISEPGSPDTVISRTDGNIQNRWIAVVPVRGFTTAKSRLRDALPAATVNRLASSLATRTIDALRECASIARIIVVSDIDLSAELAGGRVECLVQSAGGGINEAVAEAVDRASTEDPLSPVLVIHADLPYITAGEIESLLDEAGALERDGYLPDRAGTGSTAAVLRAGSSRPTAFGPNSASAHRSLGFVEIRRPPVCGLRNDLDTLEQYRVYTACRALHPLR